MATTSTDSVVSVRLGQEVLEALDKLAGAMDRSRSWLIAEAVSEYVDREAATLADILEGQREIESGKGIPHEQVSRWIDDLTAGKGRPKAFRK